jgi:hypothetical protein
MVKEEAKQPATFKTQLLVSSWLLGIFLDLEDGGCTFLRKDGKLISTK